MIDAGRLAEMRVTQLTHELNITVVVNGEMTDVMWERQKRKYLPHYKQRLVLPACMHRWVTGGKICSKAVGVYPPLSSADHLTVRRQS